MRKLRKLGETPKVSLCSDEEIGNFCVEYCTCTTAGPRCACAIEKHKERTLYRQVKRQRFVGGNVGMNVRACVPMCARARVSVCMNRETGEEEFFFPIQRPTPPSSTFSTCCSPTCYSREKSSSKNFRPGNVASFSLFPRYIPFSRERDTPLPFIPSNWIKPWPLNRWTARSSSASFRGRGGEGLSCSQLMSVFLTRNDQLTDFWEKCKNHFISRCNF